MSNQDFSQMDEPTLRSYVLDNRTDEEAFQAFLERIRRHPAIWLEPGEPFPPEVIERLKKESTRRGDGSQE